MDRNPFEDLDKFDVDEMFTEEDRAFIEKFHAEANAFFDDFENEQGSNK